MHGRHELLGLCAAAVDERQTGGGHRGRAGWGRRVEIDRRPAERLAGVRLSTLSMARTPDSARGRVFAAAGAVFGGAQGTSLLLGGAVAIVLSPRAIYALAGLLGLAAAGLLAATTTSRTSSRATPAEGSA